MTGADLRKAREALGLTQKELSKRLGITSMTLYRHESAKKIPKLIELAVKQIADEER